MLNDMQSEKKCASSPKHGEGVLSVDVTSDDDSYAGVEQISDSEEDEPNVEKEEELAIIFAEDGKTFQNTPQNILEDTWEGFQDLNNPMDDIPLFGQDNMFEDNWCLRTDQTRDEKSTECVNTRQDRSIQFESSDDEFDMFDDLFPDIFINKDHLDSSFRRKIDHDEVSDEGSYWDHDNVESCASQDTVMEIPKNEDYLEYESDSSMNGYESDISGETTDDDLPAEYYLQSPKTTVQIPEVESDTEGDTQNSSPACTPRLYSWKHTSDMPFATVASNCKKLILFNVHDLRRFGPIKGHQQFSNVQQKNQVNSSSLSYTNPNNCMISTIQNPPASNSNNFIPTELSDFYAPLAMEHGPDISTYSSSCYDSDDFHEDSCAEIFPDLDEFINFEPDESSSREAESSNHAESNSTNSIYTPEDNNEDQVHPLISHFNKGVVGSWRQKQNTHKLLHRNIVTPDSLAFGGNRFMEGTLKGVKTGRLKHANTPITPVRKQRPRKF